MKVNELMIGDWVEMNFYSPQPCDDYPDEDWRPVQLKTQEEISNCANCVYPLALTKQILQKNGFFNKIKINYISYQLLNNYKLILIAEDAGRTHWELLKKSKGRAYIKIKEIHYVHQFQHLLKDLKIEKEIIL